VSEFRIKEGRFERNCSGNRKNIDESCEFYGEKFFEGFGKDLSGK